MVGDLAVDFGQRRVTVGGEAVELTVTEYELLRGALARFGTRRDP